MNTCADSFIMGLCNQISPRHFVSRRYHQIGGCSRMLVQR
jgi:hypothetical protein